MKRIHLDLGERGYDISLGSGLLDRIDEYFNLERKVFIVTDSLVPREYCEKVAKKAKNARI